MTVVPNVHLEVLAGRSNHLQKYKMRLIAFMSGDDVNSRDLSNT